MTGDGSSEDPDTVIPGAPPIVLQRLTSALAGTLGQALAQIEPWSRYPIGPAALAAFFAADDAGAKTYAVLAGVTCSGALCLRQNWLRGPYIQFLGLMPNAQAQGLGTRLIGWVESDARAKGERNIWVAASDFNSRAIRFYERHGFVRVATLDDLVMDGRGEILFRKRL